MKDNSHLFKPGQSGNPKGKPKGTVHNKRLRQMISEFLHGNFSQVEDDFKKLRPKDRVRFYIDLLQYGAPKLQALNVTHDLQSQLKNFASDEELLEFAEALIERKTIHLKQIDSENDSKAELNDN
jgi:hypothetical protein